MRGKASERHKPRMKLPKVSENGETEYKYNQEQYERFPLEKLFDRLGKTTKEELPKTGMIVNRRNVESIIEKAIVNNIATDQLGISLYGEDEASELENLRIKQRDNPYLRKLINRPETGTKKQILQGQTELKKAA